MRAVSQRTCTKAGSLGEKEGGNLQSIYREDEGVSRKTRSGIEGYN